MVDLGMCALGVSIANTWVRFSSYTKGAFAGQNLFGLPKTSDNPLVLVHKNSSQIMLV